MRYMYPPPEMTSRGPTYKVDFGWIGESWTYLGQAAGPWVGSLALYTVIFLAIIGMISEVFPKNPGAVSPSAFNTGSNASGNISDLGVGVFLALTWIGCSFLFASYSRMAVKQVRGERIDFGDAFSGAPLMGRFLLLSLVVTAAVCFGLVLLLIGAFFAFVLLMPAAALIADGESFGAAVIRSVNGVRRDWLAAGLFAFMLWLVMELSGLLCGLGSFATTPMFFLVTALMYRDMVGMPGIIARSQSYGAPQPGVWPPPPGIGNAPSYGQPGPPPQSGAWPPEQHAQWPLRQGGSQPVQTPSPQTQWPPQSTPPPPTGWPTQSTPTSFGQAASNDVNRPMDGAP